MKARQIYEIESFTRGGDPYAKLGVGESRTIATIDSEDLFTFIEEPEDLTPEKREAIDRHCIFIDTFPMEYKDIRAEVLDVLKRHRGKYFYDADPESDSLWLVISDVVLPGASPLSKGQVLYLTSTNKGNGNKWINFEGVHTENDREYPMNEEAFTRGGDVYKKLGLGAHSPFRIGEIITNVEDLYHILGNVNLMTGECKWQDDVPWYTEDEMLDSMLSEEDKDKLIRNLEVENVAKILVGAT